MPSEKGVGGEKGRVAASEYDEWIDQAKRNTIGVGRKSPPENFRQRIGDAGRGGPDNWDRYSDEMNCYNRYCLKHIYDNMKLQWRGNQYKDLLLRCATATTITWNGGILHQAAGPHGDQCVLIVEERSCSCKM
ncbi:hypothetical protein Tco_0237195 [Tanacetum coccineum]